jgi:phosphatidylethanolamine/phosphatidyl-N-methylethanolamine N-methyltransferase
MDQQSVAVAYRRLSKQYDRFFGRVFEPGRRLAVDKMDCRPGERVLEVGVGTGLSLRYYPEDVHVTGIDVSPHMLDRARARLNGAADRVDLALMDAQALEYADASFDKVVAMYVASVVPEPRRMVAEMQRVCRPGGELFIVNHFSRNRGAMAAIERLASPVSRFVGFRTSFPLEVFLAESDLNVIETVPVNLFGYWKLIRVRNG